MLGCAEAAVTANKTPHASHAATHFRPQSNHLAKELSPAPESRANVAIPLLPVHAHQLDLNRISPRVTEPTRFQP